jgi:hypothetical protein
VWSSGIKFHVAHVIFVDDYEAVCFSHSCYIRSMGVARHMPKIASGTQKLIVLDDFLIDEGELGAAFKFGNLGLETDATGRQEPSTINHQPVATVPSTPSSPNVQLPEI